jgi:lysophospholipase L1-like esterase
MKQTITDPSATRDPSTSLKNLVKYLIQAGLWICIALIGFEIGLLYFRNPNSEVSYDQDWGVHHAGGSTVVWRTEGNGIIHLVADGEEATPYQGGANIVVFGDSHTEAYQVNDNQNFVSLAEARLRDNGILVDLHNLGYSGGSLADYVYWAPHAESKYDPAFVVIQISTQDFSGSGGREGYTLSDQGNYFRENVDGTLEIAHQILPNNYNRFHDIIQRKSVLLSYAYERLNLYRQNFSNVHQAQNITGEMQPLPSNESALDQKLMNYRAQLTALHTAYQGQRVVMLVLPFYPTISEDQVILEDKEYTLLLEQAKQFSDWEVVDPLPAFQALWLKDHKLTRGFNNTVLGSGHLNVDGHALVGKLLADKIVEALR